MIKPNFRAADCEWERRIETCGLQHFVEEVKLEWAPGQVVTAEGGRAGGPAEPLAGEKGHSLQKGREEPGAALPSDAPVWREEQLP